ncbi:MAG: Dyp-type peroxidase [Rothia sp. (in: high G+C Gram-positive bacteria)]|nr:Dyp-type peroxidase [Rothia sp. (in: high G+C Gram-positive bacteria)]
MATQNIVVPPARASLFLTLVVRDGHEKDVRAVLAGVSDLEKSVTFRNPPPEMQVNIGIGSKLWDRMITAIPRPTFLTPFTPVQGAKHQAPATDGDILVHVRAEQIDQAFEFSRLLLEQMGEAIEVVDEVHGFKFFDNRDLLGFVDGSANPTQNDAFKAALTSRDQDPHYEGSSYVIVQKYLHNMQAWDSLTVEEQERVIGRYKLNDVEIPDNVKATNSHVALNSITDDEGNEHEILRDNMPFGTLGSKEFGTYFIGYAGDPSIIELMLRHMYIGNPEGNYDRILDFSTPHTGAKFFVPTKDFLDGIDDLPLPVTKKTNRAS